MENGGGSSSISCTQAVHLAQGKALDNSLEFRWTMHSRRFKTQPPTNVVRILVDMLASHPWLLSGAKPEISSVNQLTGISYSRGRKPKSSPTKTPKRLSSNNFRKRNGVSHLMRYPAILPYRYQYVRITDPLACSGMSHKSGCQYDNIIN